MLSSFDSVVAIYAGMSQHMYTSSNVDIKTLKRLAGDFDI
jgi:hypothetical protein